MAGLRHFTYFVLNKTFFYSSYRFIWYGMRQRRDVWSMFWLRWIHHFLSFMGNVDLWAIYSSESVFQGYKLERGRWTHLFLVVFPGKTTDNWIIRHSLGVENNTPCKYTVSQSKGEVCPLYSYFTFISFKKKVFSGILYDPSSCNFWQRWCCWGMGVRLGSWIGSSQFLFTKWCLCIPLQVGVGTVQPLSWNDLLFTECDHERAGIKIIWWTVSTLNRLEAFPFESDFFMSPQRLATKKEDGLDLD